MFITIHVFIVCQIIKMNNQKTLLVSMVNIYLNI